jgi:hypothetical protein
MSVIEWLLDTDPSIRWQVMRDLVAESDATVARERSRVAAEGWGARLLDLQGSDGHWGGAAFVPHAWISTTDTLPPVQIAFDRTDCQLRSKTPAARRVDAVFVSHALALRHLVGARLPAQSRLRARPAHRRGGRSGGEEA